MNHLRAHPILLLRMVPGATILAGVFSYTLFVRLEWRQVLIVWGVAAALQIVILPIGASVLLYIEIMILLMLFPPQFF